MGEKRNYDEISFKWLGPVTNTAVNSLGYIVTNQAQYLIFQKVIYEHFNIH